MHTSLLSARAAASLFGAAATSAPGHSYFCDDRRYDPLFRLGLALPTATLNSTRNDLHDVFPTGQRLPTLADLAYIKHLVKVLRFAECIVDSHTKALNSVAGFWGQRSWGALQRVCGGELESASQRQFKLRPLALLTTQRLGVELTDADLTELAHLALGVPVLEYTFERYPHGAKPVLRLYCNGVAHVTLDGAFPAIYACELSKLGLQAVEYHVADLKPVDSIVDLTELHRLALWMSAPYVEQRQLRQATAEELEIALEDGLPMGHYALFVHPANGAVHAGDHRVLMALPAFYDGAVGVATAVSDGETLLGEDLYEVALRTSA